MIIGYPEAQVEGFYVDFPQVVVVNTPEDAARAIELIVVQGEGAKGDPMTATTASS